MAESSAQAASRGPATDEHTPLLSDQAGNRDSMVSAQQDNPEPTMTPSHGPGNGVSRAIRILVICSLVYAVTVALFGVVVYLLFSLGPPRFSPPWGVGYSLPNITYTALAAAISSSFWLFRFRNHQQRSLVIAGFITILVDAVVVLVLGSFVSEDIWSLASRPAGNFCDTWRPKPDPREQKACEDYAWKVRIVLWIYVLHVILLILIHAVLFILRFVSVYKARSPRGTQVSQWTFPSWNFTVEFTIKFQRPDGGNGPATTGATTSTEPARATQLETDDERLSPAV